MKIRVRSQNFGAHSHPENRRGSAEGEPARNELSESKQDLARSVTEAVLLHARSLGPGKKTRAFGMTLLSI